MRLMQFGVCTTLENTASLRGAGWDFVEARVDQLLQGELSDAAWTGAARAKDSALPILAANVLVPPTLKITGPDVNADKLRDYLAVVIGRASKIGMKTLVFGSGGARNVPEGFDHARARKQIVEFLRSAVPSLDRHGITLVVEHLNFGECNIINTIDEAMTYVRELNHPRVQCLLDTYHFWFNKEPMSSIAPALAAIKHVHVADVARTAPGTDRGADYHGVFSILKSGGYDGPICVEANWPDMSSTAKQVLEFLKQQWRDA